MKTDRIEGVSECIIMGQSMAIGTGGFRVVRKLGLEDAHAHAGAGAGRGGCVLGRKECVFEESWDEIYGRRKTRS